MDIYRFALYERRWVWGSILEGVVARYMSTFGVCVRIYIARQRQSRPRPSKTLDCHPPIIDISISSALLSAASMRTGRERDIFP